MGKKNEKILHGNQAKVDKHKDIQSVYTTNSVTNVVNYNDSADVTKEVDIWEAKKYSEENQK